MTRQKNKTKLLNTIGPGLLFASSAIGTSHLVLSTRAGAHHGMIYLFIILLALILKYPFYEYGPRYANATGFSLLKGYRDLGKWAVYIFLVVICINMFAVVAAISAVSAGLLSTVFGVTILSVPILSGVVIALSVIILLLGGYKGLDGMVKLISAVLLLSVLVAFVAVLLKGSIKPVPDFDAASLLEGRGLILLISLLGWMPAGMEASAMNSIWTVEKIKSTDYYPKLKETLFDFRLGYFFTLLLALMFMTIGAMTVYGSGIKLDGNATQFSNKLIKVFTQHLGTVWYPIIAIAAFGAIYGTLIAVLDAFPRCFVRGWRALKYDKFIDDKAQNLFIEKNYKWVLIILGLGGFLLFYLSAASMIKLLEFVTITSFLLSPILAFINLKVMLSSDFPDSHTPPSWLRYLSYFGLIAMLVFSFYYLYALTMNLL